MDRYFEGQAVVKSLVQQSGRNILLFGFKDGPKMTNELHQHLLSLLY